MVQQQPNQDRKERKIIHFSILILIGLGHFLQALNSDSGPSNRSHYKIDEKNNEYGTDRELGEYIENYQQERGDKQ
ncbi:hypothetical protein [Bacillus sp. SJS]|uniref:hypothetical protein n=1 Tax=Bacillus sp. SJS TaxID=1423321 RepID=UPI0004DD019A|nr:hypothetical protein [Bacillus sp. SJS]KZZ84844.1 hypothetical protein AS29_007215 [Bacillus sp. SJS]